MLHHPTCKIIQECNDKMPKRNTNGKYDVMASFIMLCFLKHVLMKPQMIQMPEDELARVWKEVNVGSDILLWVVPEFYNWHSLRHVSPDIMNKVSSVNSCSEMTSLAKKTEMWNFTHYPVPSVMNGITLCLIRGHNKTAKLSFCKSPSLNWQKKQITILRLLFEAND